MAVGIICVGLLSAPSRPQVVGTLAPDDLREILGMVRKELRTQLLPSFEWDSFRSPGYSIKRLREYRAQHILWVEVHRDGSVDVYAGVSKDVIREEGYVWSFRKGNRWGNTGFAYWASSDVAPADIHVPPSP